MERRDLGRITAFTDGVIAVAITLLVLNIEVPSVRGKELGSALVDLLPSLGAYLLSFALIGRYWVLHHNLFERLRNFDALLMALNLAFLALIALMPFSTQLFDDYTDEPLAAAVFGATLGLAGLVNWLMTTHTLRRGFLETEGHADMRRFGGPAGLAFSAIFFLSVPAAFVSVYISQVLWLSVILVRYPLRRLAG